MLEKNPDRIHWNELSLNPNGIRLLVSLNLKKMKSQCKQFSEELVSNVFKPSRIERMSEKHNLEMEDYLELL